MGTSMTVSPTGSRRSNAAALYHDAAEQLHAIPDHRVHLRLLAISKCETTPPEKVAEFFEVSPSTLRRWMRAFKQGGAEALVDQPRGHRAAKLSTSDINLIGTWLRSGSDPCGDPKRWTLAELRRAVREEFGVEISLMPLWRHLRMNGYWRYLPSRKASRAA